MSTKQQFVKLNDGNFIPALSFGTYKPQEVRMHGSQCFQASYSKYKKADS